MTTNKNVEEMMKEIDEIQSHDSEQDTIIVKRDWIKSFLLHAHNEGYKAGVEKAVEVVEETMQEVEDETPMMIKNQKTGDYSCAYCGIKPEAIKKVIISHLTQLITSNNEEK